MQMILRFLLFLPSDGVSKKKQGNAKKPPAKKLTSPSDLFDNMLSGDKPKNGTKKPPAKEKVSKPKVRETLISYCMYLFPAISTSESCFAVIFKLREALIVVAFFSLN